MTNATYNAFRQGALNAEYDLDTAVLKVALVRSYTFSASHATMADVVAAGGVVNGTSAALTGVTITNGVLNADATAITTTASAANHYLILFQASAVGGGVDVAQSAQKLILFIDTGTNIPIQPGAGTLQINWPTGTSKIYKLGS